MQNCSTSHFDSLLSSVQARKMMSITPAHTDYTPAVLLQSAPKQLRLETTSYRKLLLRLELVTPVKSEGDSATQLCTGVNAIKRKKCNQNNVYHPLICGQN